MVTGASTAEAALVLVDARNGIVEQSRRHAYLSSLLGIRHLIACVNKMDLVDWDEDRFREIEGDFLALAEQLGVPDARRDPDVGAARRQRRRGVAADARGTTGRAAAAPARDARDRLRPQPRRRAPAGAVGDPPAEGRARRLPRLRRPDGRRHPAPRRRGRRAARGRAHDRRADRDARRAARRRLPADVGHGAARRPARRGPRQHDLHARRRARRSRAGSRRWSPGWPRSR